MPVKPSATVMLLACSQAWPRSAVSKFGMMAQALPVQEQKPFAWHAEGEFSEAQYPESSAVYIIAVVIIAAVPPADMTAIMALSGVGLHVEPL